MYMKMQFLYDTADLIRDFLIKSFIDWFKNIALYMVIC